MQVVEGAARLNMLPVEMAILAMALVAVGQQGWLVRGMAEGEDPSKALNG
jgi:hypothetical protein